MRRPREVGFEVAPGLMGLSNIGIVFGHVGDLLLLARLALEAAIPNENVLIELLSPDLAAMSALPRIVLQKSFCRICKISEGRWRVIRVMI